MKTKLMIVGASGHGKVIADIAKRSGYETIDYLDDAANTPLPTVGTVRDHKRFTATHDFIIAIGNNSVRQRILNEISANGGNLISLVHPAATVSDTVRIGKGTVIMAGVVVNADAVIGDGVILNTCCSVDHDCIIKDYAHISVGARVAGTVTVGERTMVGATATIINNLSVCANCVIGAGAVVVKSIEEAGTYIGVPAKRR